MRNLMRTPFGTVLCVAINALEHHLLRLGVGGFLLYCIVLCVCVCVLFCGGFNGFLSEKKELGSPAANVHLFECSDKFRRDWGLTWSWEQSVGVPKPGRMICLSFASLSLPSTYTHTLDLPQKRI